VNSLDPLPETPRDVIESIRQLWGFGRASTDAIAEATIEHYKKQFGNSLELLSSQLYQSETHYFLEFLQNADDNEYPSVAKPSLSVAYDDNRVVFENNERGFKPEEVRALCSLGNSTKKGRKAVQIGEKGIGFKSVFLVSDHPEIHSNGFSFCFDRSRYGILGLVIPEWLEADYVDQPIGTRIVVPLRDPGSWRLEPKHLKPELLVFLRRLRHLSVIDRINDWSVELSRTDLDDHVEVHRRETSDETAVETRHRFFVHRKSVSMDDISEKLRADVRQTEVVIALPIGDDGSADADQQRDVFAFLPVLNAGFRFVCHADFVLVTSREEVLKGRPWNNRLRDALGEALADALVTSRRVPLLGRTALRYLTNPKLTTNDFFRPIVSLALERLKHLECVPTKGKHWATPSQAVRRDRVGLSRLLTPAALRDRLGLQYVDDSVKDIGGPLDLLGCNTLSVDHLVDCTR
jgi:hypothetical protein